MKRILFFSGSNLQGYFFLSVKFLWTQWKTSLFFLNPGIRRKTRSCSGHLSLVWKPTILFGFPAYWLWGRFSWSGCFPKLFDRLRHPSRKGEVFSNSVNLTLPSPISTHFMILLFLNALCFVWERPLTHFLTNFSPWLLLFLLLNFLPKKAKSYHSPSTPIAAPTSTTTISPFFLRAVRPTSIAVPAVPCWFPRS